MQKCYWSGFLLYYHKLKCFIIFFTGDFGTAEIKLDFNNLTFFYEPVYKPLLQSMATAAQTGNLSISSSKWTRCGTLIS